MRSLLVIIFALSFANAAFAQRTFSRGPGQGIDSIYFDPLLAPFYHGVASGDPLQDKVIIWTRVTPETDTIIPIEFFVATDTLFQQMVYQGSGTTDFTKDYTFKYDVPGLSPGTTYFYYFRALGKNSLIGRTRTLPNSTANHVKLAVVSCTNYQMGFFNGYKKLAERTDLDAVLHLGDYIYEYPTFGYGYTAQLNRRHQPDNLLITLEDYRIRHSFYKLDPDLRAAHQQQAFICVWDDHEIVNNTYEFGADSHDDALHGDFDSRKQAAVRAYLEWLPIRHPEYTYNARIYRQFKFGELVDLLMIDTRLEGRTKQNYQLNSPAFNDTTRSILGLTQRQWLTQKLQSSTASWKVIGNQVMFSETVNALKLEAWVGYPYERNLMMQTMKQLNDKNLVVLTGDTHRAWAFDLTEFPNDPTQYLPETGNGTFGIEICTPSLASPNRNEGAPGTNPAPFEATELAQNPHLRYVDLDNHGFVILDITPNRVQADYFHTDTHIKSSREDFAAARFTWKDQGFLRSTTTAAAPKTGLFYSAPERPFGTLRLGVENNQDLLLVGVYPNPATEVFYVGLVCNQAQKIQINLIASNGEIVRNWNYAVDAGNQTMECSLAGVSKGNYILQVVRNGKIQTRKLTVQ